MLSPKLAPQQPRQSDRAPNQTVLFSADHGSRREVPGHDVRPAVSRPWLATAFVGPACPTTKWPAIWSPRGATKTPKKTGAERHVTFCPDSTQKTPEPRHQKLQKATEKMDRPSRFYIRGPARPVLNEDMPRQFPLSPRVSGVFAIELAKNTKIAQGHDPFAEWRLEETFWGGWRRSFAGPPI